MSPRMLVLPAMMLSQMTFATPPDAQAVEFYNATLGHYFLTASATEAAGIDRGGAGADWIRTGRTFGAWVNAANAPSGSTTVCRFYSRGANSHFFTADAAECASLAALEVTERAAATAGGSAFNGWKFEGTAFSVLTPATGQGVHKDAQAACAADSVAMFRVYNDGFANGAGANHRFVDDSGLQQLMVDRGWVNEGVAFCVAAPADRSTATIPIVAAATSFPELAASWSGSAEWETKTLPAGLRTETPTALNVVITNAGVVSGTGNGCSLSGRIERADAARAFYSGAIDTTGCTDARFNGANKLSIERPASGPLQFHFGRKTTALAIEVEAALGNGTTNMVGGGNDDGAHNGGGGSGSGGGNSGGGNNGGGNNGTTLPPFVLSGAWSSASIQWTSTLHQGGQPDQTVTGPHPLSLTISSTNAITGSGFGCTFSGTATQPSAGKPVFVASLAASGCTSPAFNGAFANASLAADGSNALEIELERETETRGIKSRVKIEGMLKK